MPQKHLLIVAHAPSPNTLALREAAKKGAMHPDLDNLHVRVMAPLDAGPDDVLKADGILLGTTENLGYMSGALKDFFDRSYYPCLEEKQGMPCALYIRAGLDGTGTQRAVSSILTGLRWKLIQPPLILHGQWMETFCDETEELSMALAAGLDMGLF